MSKKRDDKEFTNNYYNPLTAKTEKQKQLFNALATYEIIIAYGAAGTGKTACVVSKACEDLYNKKIEKIVISRPAKESGETLGHLPGEIDQKFDPYLAPIRCIMNDILGKSTIDYNLKSGNIEVVPLAYCRGRTFNNSFIILDEAQNSTPEQMKMFLTRIGHNSKMTINGDNSQVDIRGPNGLDDAIRRHRWIPSLAIVEFDRKDIVRNSIISDILSGYDNYS